jgi:hypothetical protein
LENLVCACDLHIARYPNDSTIIEQDNVLRGLALELLREMERELTVGE